MACTPYNVSSCTCDPCKPGRDGPDRLVELESIGHSWRPNGHPFEKRPRDVHSTMYGVLRTPGSNTYTIDSNYEHTGDGLPLLHARSMHSAMDVALSFDACEGIHTAYSGTIPLESSEAFQRSSGVDSHTRHWRFTPPVHVQNR